MKKKPTRPPYNEDEIILFARILYYHLDGDPEKLLKDAAARATADDVSRYPARRLALEVLPELARLVRENPSTKKSVLLARLAESRGMKMNALRDVLSRVKKLPRVLMHYVRDPEKKAPIWAALEKAEAEVEAARRSPPPHTTPSRTAPLPGRKRTRKGSDDDRKAPVHRRGRRVPRTPSADLEEVANVRSVARLHQGVREQVQVLHRRSEKVGGRKNAPAHGRQRRPGRVRKPPP